MLGSTSTAFGFDSTHYGRIEYRCNLIRREAKTLVAEVGVQASSLVQVAEVSDISDIGPDATANDLVYDDATSRKDGKDVSRKDRRTGDTLSST